MHTLCEGQRKDPCGQGAIEDHQFWRYVSWTLGFHGFLIGLFIFSLYSKEVPGLSWRVAFVGGQGTVQGFQLLKVRSRFDAWVTGSTLCLSSVLCLGAHVTECDGVISCPFPGLIFFFLNWVLWEIDLSPWLRPKAWWTLKHCCGWAEGKQDCALLKTYPASRGIWWDITNPLDFCFLKKKKKGQACVWRQ